MNDNLELATNGCAQHGHLDGTPLTDFVPAVVLEADQELPTVPLHPATREPVGIIEFDDGSKAEFVERVEVCVFRVKA